MKNLFLLIVTLAFGSFVFGQTGIYADNFDAYTAGTQLTVQNSVDWTTWSGTPGTGEDPYVSDALASSPDNSVYIVTGNDLVKPMANYTSGKYLMSFEMYIPTGGDGYFNTLSLFAGAASEWGMQVYFGHTNLNEGNIDGGAALAQIFTFSYDTWMTVEVTVDIDGDWGEFYLDDVLIHGWIWSTGTFGDPGLHQLGGNNFYAWDGGVNANPEFFIDDYVFLMLDPPTNLNYTISNYFDVNLTWTAPPMEALTGYNVYRDGTQINTSLVTGTSYDDLGLAEDSYDYYVTAVYDEGESGPSNIVTVVITGPCAAPSGLNTDNITFNSARANWTIVGTPDTLFIEWGLPGFTYEVDPIGRDTITSIVGPGTNYTIMGLLQGVTYEWYVQSHCTGGTVSTPAGPASFFTPLSVITIPFTEDFEPAEFGLFENGPGNDVDWVLIDTLQVSPTHSVLNEYGTNNDNVLRLIGKFDLTAKAFAKLSFSHIAKTEGGWDKCFVEISTDGGLTFSVLPESYYMGASDYSDEYFDEDSYTEWGTSYETPDNTWWKQESFNLTAYNSFSDVTVRFRLDSDVSANRAGWLIDDVTVDEMTLGTVEGYVSALATSPTLFIENATVSIPSLNMSTTTNPSGFYTMDIPAGTYDVTCEEQYYAAQTATGVVITELNTTVQDFVLPYKFGPTGLNGQGWDASIDLWWNPPFDPSVPSWLSYNDGQFENWFSSTAGGAGLAQMFTPLIYPCTIEEVRFHSSDLNYTQLLDVYILGGDMSTVLGGPYTVTGADSAWVTIDITDITINSGSFMIATYNQIPGGPYVGVDNSQYLANLYFGDHIGGFTEMGVWGYYFVGSHEAYCSFGTKENGITQVLTATQNIRELNEDEKEKLYSEIDVQNSLEIKDQIKEPAGSLIIKDGATNTKGLLGYNIYRGPDPANYAFLIYTTDPFYVDNTVTNNQDYYYYITAVFDEGESVSSNEKRLLPMAAQANDYSNNFDATNGDFFGRDDWEWGAPSVVGPPAAYSPPNVWATVLDGDYSIDSYSWLYQTFDLSAKGDYTAKFAKWFDLGAGDLVWFAVDHDNDGSFTILEQYTGLDDAWEMGYVQIPEAYTSAYTRIAFILNADGIGEAPGFYLDDFTMEVYVDPAMTVDPTSFEATVVEDGTASSNLFIDNSGGFPLEYTADIVYTGLASATVYPLSADYNTGSTDGTNFTQTSVMSIMSNGVENAWAKFDISSIPDGSFITSVEVYWYINTDNCPYFDITHVANDPLSGTAASVNTDITGGTQYYHHNACPVTGGWNNKMLAGGVEDDLQAALASDWFALGFYEYEGYGTYGFIADGWNETNIPYLVVNYSSSPIGWLSLDGGSTTSGSVNPGENISIDVGFDATGVPAGDYTTTIEIDSNDPLSEITTIPVILHVVAAGYNVSGTLTYANAPPITPTPMDVVDIQLMNGPINMGTATTDINGDYSFANVPNGNYSFRATTSKSRSGSTNLADVNLIVSHLLGTSLTGLPFLAADVTADGFVLVGDYNLVTWELLGNNPVWAAPDYIFENVAFVVADGNILNKDFQCICSGDPDQSFIPLSSLPTTVLTEGFEGTVPPTGWVETDVNGTAGVWASSTGTVHPSGGGVHGGAQLAYFNSWTANSANSSRLETVDVDLSGGSSAEVKFWMYHDAGYTGNDDRIQIQVYTGGAWVDVGTAVSRYDGTVGWAEHVIDLSAYAGGTVKVGFHAFSEYGNDCHIDDVEIVTIP